MHARKCPQEHYTVECSIEFSGLNASSVSDEDIDGITTGVADIIGLVRVVRLGFWASAICSDTYINTPSNTQLRKFTH